MHGFGILAVLLEVAVVDDVAAGIEDVIVLRGGELVGAGGLLDVQADIVPERRGGAQAVGIEAHAGAGAAAAGAAVAQVQRDRAVHLAGLYPTGARSERPW